MRIVQKTRITDKKLILIFSCILKSILSMKNKDKAGLPIVEKKQLLSNLGWK